MRFCRYGLRAVKCLTEQGLNLKQAYLSVRRQTSAVDIASTLERLASPIVTTSPACKTIVIRTTVMSLVRADLPSSQADCEVSE